MLNLVRLPMTAAAAVMAVALGVWVDAGAAADGPVRAKQSAGPLFAFQEDGKWGFIESGGDIVFPPQFSSGAFPRFSGGYAVVEYNGRKMWVSERGEVVTPPDDVSALRGFAEGLFKVNVGQQIRLGDILAAPGRWGFIDVTGAMVIPAAFGNVGHFSGGLCAATRPDDGLTRPLWGYIDKTGAWVVEPNFRQAGSFSEGMAFVGVALPGERFVKQGCINTKGQMVIPPQFEQPSAFGDGVAAVKKDGKWGYIDKAGATVVPFQYEAAEPMSEGLGLVWKWEKNAKGQIANARCGFIRKDGKPLTELKFTSGYSFTGGLAAVQVDDKYGNVDRTGEIVVEPRFASPLTFSEGLAAAQIGRKFGYADTEGNLVVAAEFDAAWPFTGGLARVLIDREKQQYAYINRKGDVVRRFTHTPASQFREG